jgi:pimeloyl-ACP methyl ester carboxylesterase
MGGAIALARGSGWFGIKPARVFGIGIKVAWTDDDLHGLTAMAAAPARMFASKDEALARYLKVSGLAGLVAADSAMANAGVVERDGGWRLAADPKTALVGAPPMAALVAAAQAPFHLARGANDRMMTLEQLRLYDPQAIDFPGLGHNAMVEDPAAVWRYIEERLA